MTVEAPAPADDWTRWALEGDLQERVRKSFRLATFRDGRDPLAFSMSKLGACRKESAFRLAGTDPSEDVVPLLVDDADERRPAWLGTWIHDRWIPKLRLALGRGARSENPVTLSTPGEHGVEVPGRLDLYWPKHGGVLVDVKTVKEWALSRVRATNARPKDQWQQDGYSAALVQSGRPVAWIATIYIDRASGATEVVVRPFGQVEYDAVMARMGELTLFALDPDTAPRDEDGPGLSIMCDGCAWLRRCWGPDARPGSSEAVALPKGVDELQVAGLLADYAEASVAEGLAKKVKERVKAQVRLLPERQYGDYELGWGRGSAGGSLAVAPTVKALKAAGVDVEVLLTEAAEAAGVEVVKTGPSKGAIAVKRIAGTA